MLQPAEIFVNSVFYWLFILLGIGTLVTVSFILRKRAKRSKVISNTYTKKSQKNIQSRFAPKLGQVGQPVNAPSSFAEKLGELVVNSMIIVSRSDDLPTVKKYMQIIRDECERLNSMNLPEDRKKIISTVFIWAKRFDIDRHINELKLFRKSTQIVYDPNRRDFKLMISGE